MPDEFSTSLEVIIEYFRKQVDKGYIKDKQAEYFEMQLKCLLQWRDNQEKFVSEKDFEYMAEIDLLKMDLVHSKRYSEILEAICLHHGIIDLSALINKPYQMHIENAFRACNYKEYQLPLVFYNYFKKNNIKPFSSECYNLTPEILEHYNSLLIGVNS